MTARSRWSVCFACTAVTAVACGDVLSLGEDDPAGGAGLGGQAGIGVVEAAAGRDSGGRGGESGTGQDEAGGGRPPTDARADMNVTKDGPVVKPISDASAEGDCTCSPDFSAVICGGGPGFLCAAQKRCKAGACVPCTPMDSFMTCQPFDATAMFD